MMQSLRLAFQCSTLIPFSVEYFAEPVPFYEMMREAGPFVWLSRYGVGLVARYEFVREALTDWQVFCSSRGVGMEDFARHGQMRSPSLLIEADPPERDEARKVVGGVLSRSVLQDLRATFAEKAEALVASLMERRRLTPLLTWLASTR